MEDDFNLTEDSVEKWRKTFALLLSDKKELLCIVNKEGYFIELNSAWTDCLGYDLPTLKSRPFTDFIHPEDIDSTIEQHQNATEGVISSRIYTNRYRTAWGDYKYLTWSGFTVGNLGYGLARDVTELKTIQKTLQDKNHALQQGETKLRTITDALPVFVFQLNHNGTIAFYNSVCTDLFFQQEAMGLDYNNVFPEEIVTLIQYCLTRFGTSQDRQEYEVELQHGGMTKILKGVVEIFSEVDKDLQGYIFTGWDVTQQRRQEEEQLRLISEATAAKEASRLKSEFLAYMSHELRTPLVGIMGISEFLLNTLEMDEEQERMAGKVKYCSQLLLSIINDILDLSKIEANKLSFHNEPFDLIQCIQNNMDLYSTKAIEKDIDVMYYTAPDLPTWIIGDKTRLDQVLGNVLSNALKFTQEGSIILECECEKLCHGTNSNKAKQEPCLLWQEGTPVKITFIVQDTGIGISETSMHRIFQPFTQADSSTTRLFGGTGLGLTICKRLLHMMNGDIDCESQLGKGSQFTITMSTLTASSRDEKQCAPVDAFNVLNYSTSHKILIVDDSEQTTQVFLKYCHQWNLVPTCVNYEESHLVEFAAESLAIVLMVHKKGISERTVATLSPYRQKVILCTNVLFQPGEPLGVFPMLLRTQFSLQDLERFLRNLIEADTTSKVLLTDKKEPSQTLLTIEDVRQLVQKSIPPVVVLVVDDNAINREVVGAILKKMEIEFEFAVNGKEAVEKVQSKQGSEPYAMILMDCQMPLLDGYEATLEIRRWEREKGMLATPIIALTASAMKEDENRCRSAGMDDYLAKPYSLSVLCSTIHQWLSRANECGR